MTKLHIENVHIHIGGKTPVEFSGLLSAINGGADAALPEPSNLPVIGDYWPGTKAIYAGKAPSRDGSKIVDLIFWLDEDKKGRSYEDNIKFCESRSVETKSHAATRQQAIVINDNLCHLLSTDHAYWTETKDNTGKYAFVQYFLNGTQRYGHLGGESRALAVSEIH